ncbi:UNVERIFIED_ORG: hypothetical protein ABIC62_002424 [Burkholderia sp. 1595]|uniref:UrcA family protein n=1 Tax=Paraburkholderia terricola TaxID=169427 RepID=A0ABU1LSN4_9BURK|nr:hypothetical protein [Paraburkholderia terricola]MDR6409749.1 hypothetical protein [Paraburkholderia terricola]
MNKNLLVLALMLAMCDATRAQWIGSAQPVQTEQAGARTTYSAQDRLSANRRIPDCAERQRQAAQALMAAARQGDPRNYSMRFAALAPSYRVDCN